MTHILLLRGIPCASCSVPAKSHNFQTGQTYHVSIFKPPCQTQIPPEVTREVFRVRSGPSRCKTPGAFPSPASGSPIAG